MRRLVPIIVAAALFCAGVACGWLMRGEDGLTVDERMEKFKRERPDEFAALQRRRESMRSARAAAAAKRQEFFDTINLSFLTEEQRKTHEAYADALAVRQAARERIATCELEHGFRRR